MGRRRGSADSNQVLLKLKGENVFAELDLDLFTTDVSGNDVRESNQTLNNPNQGLFEDVVQNFSFSFDNQRQAVFEKEDGTKPFFNSVGNLQASLENERLTYTISVDSEGEEFSYSFGYDYKDVLGDKDLIDAGVNESTFRAELVNSLSSFSVLVDDLELNEPKEIPEHDFTMLVRTEDIVFPSFVGKAFQLGFLHIDGSGDESGLHQLNDGNITFTLDLELEEDVNPPVQTPSEPTIIDSGRKLIQGSDGDDTLFGGNQQSEELRGGDGNDTLFGNEGINFLFGGAGDDIIYGGNQLNNILGGDGNDTIYSNSGVNFIDSGSGFDLIRLGSGEDIVLLSEGEGYDTIENYQLGMTTIQGFGFFEYDFVGKNGDTEIFKGGDKLAVVRWTTPEQLSRGGSFVQ